MYLATWIKEYWRFQFFYPLKINILKKETLTQMFSSEFWEISKSNFFTEHLCTFYL